MCQRNHLSLPTALNLQLGAKRLTSKNEDETEQSTQYITAKDEEGNIAELRRLPNGVKDEIRVSGGKAELVKRVSDEVVLDGGIRFKYGSRKTPVIIIEHLFLIGH